jgi:hypothetical protein
MCTVVVTLTINLEKVKTRKKDRRRNEILKTERGRGEQMKRRIERLKNERREGGTNERTQQKI